MNDRKLEVLIITRDNKADIVSMSVRTAEKMMKNWSTNVMDYDREKVFFMANGRTLYVKDVLVRREDMRES